MVRPEKGKHVYIPAQKAGKFFIPELEGEIVRVTSSYYQGKDKVTCKISGEEQRKVVFFDPKDGQWGYVFRESFFPVAGVHIT